MTTTELVLALLGGIAVAALMCWLAVHVATRAARRRLGRNGPPPSTREPRAF
jgi:hypothetical protein